MPIKPPELLNRLPSVSELLDKPPVRALADRLNRSVVAGGVRSFLDELKNDLRRRAADMQLPSVRELAERAARYVVSRHEQQLGTAINATGRIWGPPWSSRPLADSSLERMVAVGRDFIVEPMATATREAELASALCRITGAQAAVVVHSYPGAIWLALAAFAEGREVLVARAEVGDVGPGGPLPTLVTSAHARLREVGTTNRAVAADYDAAVSPNAAVVLTISPDEYRIVGHTAAASLEELLALARDREMMLVAALGAAPLADPPAVLSGWPQLSVRDALAAGVELIALCGDGLVGGPPCGILLGSRERIARVAQHPLLPALRLDSFRSAALAATLECCQDPGGGAEDLPVWQLLSTPIENLRNRAERLAPQMARAPDVAAAVVVETRSPVSEALPADGGLPSYGISLEIRSGNITDLDNRLRNLPLPIFGRIEGDRLILDLRTVLPRQDRALVEAIVGPAISEQASINEPSSVVD
jgi:L-seryl-tRNA(Ser) seleniumtransferase